MTILINIVSMLNALIARLILFVFLRAVFVTECVFVWVLVNIDNRKKWGIFKK